MKRLKTLLFGSLVFLSLCSLAPYSNNTHYMIFDILSHFPAQYAFASFVLLFVCIRKKHISLAVLAVSLLFFNIGTVMDFDTSIQAAGQNRADFKIYSANLQVDNYELSKIIYELQEIDPEMVLLLEATPVHISQLRQLIQAYPYHIVKTFKGETEIGFVFLSKFPVLDNHVERLSDVCNFVFQAILEIDQKLVKFYGVHAQRPMMWNFSERKSQFLRLAGQLKEQKLPVIVAGDFNTTPYSPIFGEVIKITGLKDSREDFGWQPSWPTFFPPLWIPIDHVLVTPDIQVRKRRTGSYIGSDHYPVIAELSLG